MPTQTFTATPKDLEDLYNALMWEIEPELTTEILPDLDTIYRHETKEERQLRYEWYAVAYEQFLISYKEFISKCKDHLHKVGRKVLKASEKSASAQESSHLTNIEQSIDEV